MSPINETKVANELTGPSFAALRSSEITAIVLDDVVPNDECEDACRKLRILTEETTYRWSSDLRVFGVSIGEAHESSEALGRYLEEAERSTNIARNVIFSGATPVDRIAQRMLQIWQPGVRLPFLNGQPFLGQILRRWKTGGHAHPHLDQSRTSLLRPFRMERRYGLNFYAAMPTVGGGIQFWNRDITDDEYLAIKRPDYGIDRDVLGEPDLVIRPRRGQAIMFDAFKPHAVQPVGGEGERVTNACFFAYAGEENALFQFA